MLTPKELCCPVVLAWLRYGPSGEGRMGEQEEDGTAALIAPSPLEGSCLLFTHSSFPACILLPAQQFGGIAVCQAGSSFLDPSVDRHTEGLLLGMYSTPRAG